MEHCQVVYEELNLFLNEWELNFFISIFYICLLMFKDISQAWYGFKIIPIGLALAAFSDT